MKVLYDITRALTREFPAFPGDPPFEAVPVHDIASAGCLVTRLTMSAHAGTHLDSPLHVLAGGGGIDTIPLDVFMGPARVVHVPRVPGGAGLTARDLGLDEIPARGMSGTATFVERLLIRTELAGTQPRHPEGHGFISASAVEAIARLGIRLVGIDTPSVDAPESRDLPAHRALARSGVAILEWLDLSGVPPGDYTLVALPLRLPGLEASPVRAVLLDAAISFPARGERGEGCPER